MSNQPNHIEMIDAYLTGQLNQVESARLMKLIEQDPALKDEFLMQQDLIHTIQAHRKSELKARLNNIEVGTGTSYTGATALKMVAGTALVALLGAGIYFIYNQDQEINNIEPLEITLGESTTISEKPIPAIPEVTKQDQRFTQEESVGIADRKKTEEKTPSDFSQTNESFKSNSFRVSDADIAATSAPAKVQKHETAEVVKPEVISFFEDTDPSASTPEAESPEDDLNAIRSFNTQNIEVTTVTDHKYDFHYMFFDKQLHIYGEFSKVPYEVLEVNSGPTTRYFLYHNGLYYELNPNQQKITRLKELKNESMVNELEITRNEKLKQ